MSTFNFNDFRLVFMSIVFEAMPFIVIGAIVSGVLEELLPQQWVKRMLPRNRFLAIVVSSLLGIFMPMCECGIVPVMRRLLRKGVPASCAITYMLSAPGMNVIVLSSTALAFWGYRDGAFDLAGVGGLGMVLLRAGFAFTTAVTVGLVIDRLAQRGIPLVREDTTRVRLVESSETRRLLEEEKLIASVQQLREATAHHHHHDHAPGEACSHPPGHVHDHDHEHEHEHDHEHEHHHEHSPHKRGVLDRLKAIAEISLGDFIDIAAFLVIGALLAAAISTALPRATIEQLANNHSLSIAATMGLAFLLSICSEADAFVAANFRGLSTGSKLAFIVLGPMLDVKLFIMYRWVFTRRTLLTMIPIIVVMIYALCWTWDVIEPTILGAESASRSGTN